MLVPDFTCLPSEPYSPAGAAPISARQPRGDTDRMRRTSRFLWVVLACATVAGAGEPPLAFRIDEGRNINSFLRDGPVAAHLLLRSGSQPRVLVAFPAGNSGVGLWLEDTTAPVTWALLSPPRPFTALDGQHRPLHGIEFEVGADTPELRIRAAVLSSVRVLRDYELQREAPEQVLVDAHTRDGGVVTWARDRLDGAAGYRLTVEVQGEGRVSANGFSAEAGMPLRLRIRALTGETPLVAQPALTPPRAEGDLRARNALAFLSYREKFLAGSWRFNTYFGRDTLISALLLAPVLEPAAMESAIASVLDRLAPNGEVAHEEDIGEFAVLRHLREGRGRTATPIHDYGMVDDDFLLAPLAARWLLDDELGRALAPAFLAQRGVDGRPRGAALMRNLAWVLERTSKFARDPRATHLVGLKDERATGNWRDSEQGLGGGRYAYDINASLVPAALDSAARLASSGLLTEFADDAQLRALADAASQARVWRERAVSFFAVRIASKDARAAISAYAREAGVDARPALRALGKLPLEFNALSLDEHGRAVPIVNSDEGFRLLLTEPSAQELELAVISIMRPFPAGLMTGAGLLVANPAFAPPQLRREFSRFAYHGTVVWSWQQALLAAGLERQLRRADLPAATRMFLRRARTALWAAIDSSNTMRTSELWSWSFARGRYRVEAFGAASSDADESNAAQLWSTVYLGLTPP